MERKEELLNKINFIATDVSVALEVAKEKGVEADGEQEEDSL